MIGSVESGTVAPPPSYIALLGVCTMSEKPAVKDGQIQIRKLMSVILAFDHRAMMGNTPIEFLNQLKRNLEEPAAYLVSCNHSNLTSINL
jgi:pyruvate/2-oxoglutarate dehydrogenase complex dihydrolipoamide acyltransferase (E2) component